MFGPGSSVRHFDSPAYFYRQPSAFISYFGWCFLLIWLIYLCRYCLEYVILLFSPWYYAFCNGDWISPFGNLVFICIYILRICIYIARFLGGKVFPFQVLRIYSMCRLYIYHVFLYTMLYIFTMLSCLISSYIYNIIIYISSSYVYHPIHAYSCFSVVPQVCFVETFLVWPSLC